MCLSGYISYYFYTRNMSLSSSSSSLHIVFAEGTLLDLQKTSVTDAPPFAPSIAPMRPFKFPGSHVADLTGIPSFIHAG